MSDLFIADVEVLICMLQFSRAAAVAWVDFLCSAASGRTITARVEEPQRQEAEAISHLAAFVFSGHVVEHSSVVNEGIQFPVGREGKLPTIKWKSVTWSEMTTVELQLVNTLTDDV